MLQTRGAAVSTLGSYRDRKPGYRASVVQSCQKRLGARGSSGTVGANKVVRFVGPEG